VDQRAEQLLGRNRPPTARGVERLKAWRELGEERIDQAAEGAKRMVGRDAIFDRAITEKNRLALVGCTHRALTVQVAPKYRTPSTAPWRVSLSFLATC